MKIGIYSEDKKQEYNLLQKFRANTFFIDQRFTYLMEEMDYGANSIHSNMDVIKKICSYQNLITTLTPIESFIDEKRFLLGDDQVRINLNSNIILGLFDVVLCYNKNVNTTLVDPGKIKIIKQTSPQDDDRVVKETIILYQQRQTLNESNEVLDQWISRHRKNHTS